MNRDLVNNIAEAQSVVVVAGTSGTGTYAGTAVDLQGFDSAEVVGLLGAAGAGTIKIQECATSGGTYTDVAAAEVEGTQGTALVQNGAVSLGYKGQLRYIKAHITVTIDGVIGGLVIKGNPFVAKA